MRSRTSCTSQTDEVVPSVGDGRSELVVATWNVAHGGDRPELLAGCVASLGASIVALQEVDVGTQRARGRDQVADIATATGMTGVFGAVAPFRGGRYGNALLVHGDVTDVERISLRVPRRRQRRGALVASTVVTGHTITVATAHLGLERDEAVDQLARVLEVLDARPGPQLLLGDLNLRTEQVVPWLSAAGFTATTTGSPTFPAHRPRIRIDHAAARGATVAGSRVVRLETSDHCAVVAGVYLSSTSPRA